MAETFRFRGSEPDLSHHLRMPLASISGVLVPSDLHKRLSRSRSRSRTLRQLHAKIRKQARTYCLNWDFERMSLSSFIWSVADLLRGDYKQSEYGKVILPFTVLRRMDYRIDPRPRGQAPHELERRRP